MWREPPEPMTGLEASTSGVARARPRLLSPKNFLIEPIEKIG